MPDEENQRQFFQYKIMSKQALSDMKQLFEIFFFL